jgi:O-antigen biosynthesis protein
VPDAPSGLVTVFRRLGETRFAGHVFHSSDPSRRFVVEILVDGLVAACVTANRFEAGLKQDESGGILNRLDQSPAQDLCYGFSCDIERGILDHARLVEARIANIDWPVGHPVELADAIDVGAPFERRVGVVMCPAGLRLIGTTLDRGNPASPARIRIEENGELVAAATPRRWQARASFREAVDQIPFDIRFDERFADGKPHRLHVTDETGAELEGSPVTVLAGGELSSMPFSQTKGWLEMIPPTPVTGRVRSVRIIIIGDDNIVLTLDSLATETSATWSLEVVPASRNGLFAPEEFARIVCADIDDEEFVVLARAGTEFRPGALAAITEPFETIPETRLSYADIILATGNLRYPVLHSTYDHERMLEQGYLAHLFATRLQDLEACLPFAPRSLYDIALAMIDETGQDGVSHVPLPLATIPMLDVGQEAEILLAAHEKRRLAAAADDMPEPSGGSLFPALRLRRSAGSPSIAILVHDADERAAPDEDSRAVLKAEIEVIAASYPGTISLVEPGNDDLPSAWKLGSATALNVAAAASKADCLLLLHEAIGNVTGDLISELVSRLADPSTAIVAPVIERDDDSIAHAGYCLGPGFAFADRAAGLHMSDNGYADMLAVAHQATAVSWDAAMIRRTVFLESGGFDTRVLPSWFADIDLCLRLRAAGRRIVVTPHARVRWMRPVRDRQIDRSGSDVVFTRSLASLRNRWGQAIADDPFYSPLLNRDGPPFTGLACPPGTHAPRRGTIAKPWLPKGS